MIKNIVCIIYLLIFFVISCANVQKKYYPDGKLSEEYRLKDGRVDGEKKDFYPDGKIKSITNYLAGEIMDSTIYYATGQKGAIFKFKNGKINGSVMTYYSNGNPCLIENYKSGKLNGELKYYSDRGSLSQFFLYINDSVVYVKVYDSITGKIIDERTPPQFKVEKDTIKLGEYYNANIKFYGPPFIGKAILYGAYYNKERYKTILDPIDTLKNMQLKLRWKPTELGKYKFDGILRIVKPNTDSIEEIPFYRFIWVKR